MGNQAIMGVGLVPLLYLQENTMLCSLQFSVVI